MSGARNLEGLKTQMLECIEATYDKGYKSGLKDGNINDGTFAAKVKEAYDNGLNDAWECAKKIVTDTGLNYEELGEIFGYTSMDTIFGNFSASEAVTKVKEYEDEQKKPDDEIHVGDEIYQANSTHKYIVTAFLNNGGIIVLGDDGFTVVFARDEIYKTGRNYPIKAILKELGNGEE
jgi:hypothetical protein